MPNRRKIRYQILMVLVIIAGLCLGLLCFNKVVLASSGVTERISATHGKEGSVPSKPGSAANIPIPRKSKGKSHGPVTPDFPIQIGSNQETEVIQCLQKELRYRLSRLKKEKRFLFASDFYLQRPAPVLRTQSSLPEKVNPILFRRRDDSPVGPSLSSYPRYDKEGRVLIRIQYDPESMSDKSIEERIQENGGAVYAHISDDGVVEAYLPQDALTDWASYDWVKRIDPVGPAFSRIGSITTEADNLLGVQLARQKFGVDGSGVKVAVISSGVDNLSQSQTSGDLPSDVNVLANGGWPEPDDEGTAILEIIHDLAPGASLYFHDGGSETRFRMAVNAFVERGCDIIVDDIGYAFEPFFEDGPVAETVANAVSNGIVFVSAAGNDAEKHAEMNWRSTHDDPEDMNLNEWFFGAPALVFPNDEEMIVFSLGPFHNVQAVLQWSERFGQARHDYDIVVYDAVVYLEFLQDWIVWFDWILYGADDWSRWGYWFDSYGQIHYGAPAYPTLPQELYSSRNVQNGSGDPLEITPVHNYSLAWNNYIMVVEGRDSPSTSDHLEMIFWDWGVTEAVNIPGEEGTPVGSIHGHPAVPGVLAVGAIDVNAPRLDNIEPFSSQGPCYVPFSSAPWRLKPDFCAVDRVSVTGAGGFPSPFPGTSAAAPHVAGIVALLKEYCPNASGTEICSQLKETADDLGSPGHDSIFGYGRVNIYRALEAAMTLGLEDAIVALQILVGVDSGQSGIHDVNGDGRIGLEDVIYILQKLADLR